MEQEEQEKVLFNAVVCFLVKGGNVLLGMKTQKIGKGCWNGYGGGIEEGETEIEAVLREVEEETGGVVVDPSNMEKIAIGYFHNTKSDGKKFVCAVHFFLARKWEGDAKETKEMAKPTWFALSGLPLNKMMPADKEWVPLALGGKKLIVRALLGPFQQNLLAPVEIEFVDSFVG